MIVSFAAVLRLVTHDEPKKGAKETESLISQVFIKCNATSHLKVLETRLHVRESKTVLESGFHAVDSLFQAFDSSFFLWNLGFWISILSGFQIP